MDGPQGIAAVLRVAPEPKFWAFIVGCGLLGIAALYVGFRALQRSRMMEDMPTSKLRSAAQGYVELEGWARLMPGEPIRAPVSGTPCTWYSYRVEYRDSILGDDGRRHGSEWETLEKGVSEAIFFLEDGTGRCIVDPDGAEVTPSIRLCWRGDSARPGFGPRETGFLARLFASGNYRYTEHRIEENDHLYAVGQFVGLGDVAAASLSEEVRDILATWKRDHAGLLRRFDANGDGKIDMAEWDDARSEAEREALRRQRERPPQPEYNLLRKPLYGKPFLLSTVPQHTLISRNRRIFAAAAVTALGLGVLMGLALTVRFGG